MRKVKIVFNIFLGIIGVATLLVLAGHFGILNTVKPYIVQSGSMSPSVPLGSVVLVRAAPYYGQNDIITFRQNGNPKNIVTHRIVYKKFANASSEPTYFTIGDTNDDIDRYEVKSKDIVGKVYVAIPYLGYAVDFAKTPKGFILLVIIPATIIIYEELRLILGELSKVLKKKKIEEKIQVEARHNFPKTAMVVPIIGVALVFVAVTGSFFLDKEKSSENVMGAASSFVAISPTPTPTPDLSGLADHIVISEVQIATSSATTSDFVELYNPTSSNINLNGFHLVKRTQTGTSSASLKAFSSSDVVPGHGFYLWASSDGGFASQIDADVSTGENIANNNSIALLDSSDVIVDSIAWGSGHVAPLIEGSAFSTNPPANQSLERKALSTSDAASMTSGADVSKGNGFDGDDNSTDFILRSVSDPQNSSSGTEMP